MIRSRDLTVKVFRFQTEQEWQTYTMAKHTIVRDGYTWRIFRRDYKRRSMMAYRLYRNP